MLTGRDRSRLERQLHAEILDKLGEVDVLQRKIHVQVVRRRLRFLLRLLHDFVEREGIQSGQIIEQGPPATIFTNPAEPRTRQFLRKILEKV